MTTMSPCGSTCRASERSRVEVPWPWVPSASRCGSLERGPVRQSTGGWCAVPEPWRTGIIRLVLVVSVNPSTTSPLAVT
jgi:hypothetical protein